MKQIEMFEELVALIPAGSLLVSKDGAGRSWLAVMHPPQTDHAPMVMAYNKHQDGTFAVYVHFVADVGVDPKTAEANFKPKRIITAENFADMMLAQPIFRLDPEETVQRIMPALRFLHKCREDSMEACLTTFEQHFCQDENHSGFFNLNIDKQQNLC